ncbi:hypothetical protein P691DRAFT_264327 [Macrolepiota fuliginosa MF-IS2]|uniref:Uncharacterized protein n=1 Tax=Macrolepiota fuliginosa MF-IS2 TaxID=1400762 RepID=A0A9P5X6N8_9AGAR|nr:hypothetical protein P691DRAFT_264327 [Macrolepiota fuliginosa MF-IS2]
MKLIYIYLAALILSITFPPTLSRNLPRPPSTMPLNCPGCKFDAERQRKRQEKCRPEKPQIQTAVNSFVEPDLEPEGLTLLEKLRMSEYSRIMKEVIEQNRSGSGTEVEGEGRDGRRGMKASEQGCINEIDKELTSELAFVDSSSTSRK